MEFRALITIIWLKMSLFRIIIDFNLEKYALSHLFNGLG